MRIKGLTIPLAIIALGSLAVPATLAQPPRPAENVIVTAPKLAPDAVIDHFVMSYAASSRLTDKIARWRDGICPVTAGLPPALDEYVTRRVKQVAAMVGAPVQAKEPCKFNIDIVFTTEPQALLDGIREQHPALLGYHDASQSRRLATFSHPIQAWYASETEDINGARSIDDQQRNRGVDILDPVCQVGASMGCYVHLPGASEARVLGSRLGDGLSSDLYHVSVVADWHAVDGHEIGALADYIAMLALSQTGAFEACQDVASITNLMASGCDAGKQPNGITDIDLAYLRGLYKMDPAGTLQAQRSEIAYQMKKTLEGR